MPDHRTTCLPVPFSPFLQAPACLCFCLFLFFFTSCSTFNGTKLHMFGKNVDLIDFSYEIAENLVDGAMPPLVPRHPDMPVLVTTFVDNNDLTKTSRFGRLLQEHIASRLVQLGYTIREIKLTRTINIEPKSGETTLSRDLAKISGEVNSQALLVGTVSRANRILYISARLISPDNNNVISSYDDQLYMDDNILAMFGLRMQDTIDTPIAEPSQPALNAVF
jgi:TolB-like protein